MGVSERYFVNKKEGNALVNNTHRCKVKKTEIIKKEVSGVKSHFVEFPYCLS